MTLFRNVGKPSMGTMLTCNTGSVSKASIAALLMLCFSISGAAEWGEYENPGWGFSIRYPAGWNLLSQSQIDAQSGGMAGQRPSFAAHNYAGQSFFVIATNVDANALRVYKNDVDAGLRDQYSEFAFPVQSPPRGFTVESAKLSTVSGLPALDVVFSMTAQGTSFKQRQVCIIHNSQAYLLSGTSDAASFSNANTEYFSPMVSSFAIAADQ